MTLLRDLKVYALWLVAINVGVTSSGTRIVKVNATKVCKTCLKNI